MSGQSEALSLTWSADIKAIGESPVNKLKTAYSCTFELLRDHGTSQCSNPRDKIYALRALASDVSINRLRPDYSIDVHDLYWEVLQVCGILNLSAQLELFRILELSARSLLDYVK